MAVKRLSVGHREQPRVHGRSQHQGHAGLGGEGGQYLDILLQDGRVNRMHPAASAFLVVDENDGCVFDAEGLGKMCRMSWSSHDDLEQRRNDLILARATNRGLTVTGSESFLCSMLIWQTVLAVFISLDFMKGAVC